MVVSSFLIASFDMFFSAGNMTNKKKTQEESSFLANPSCSSQKSSKSVNILNVLDDTNENNFMKTFKKKYLEREEEFVYTGRRYQIPKVKR